MPVMQPQHHATYALPGSAFVILTGNINDGKTHQMKSLLEAVGEDGEPLVAPVLMLIAEASGEGTAGDFIADESLCLVWGVHTADDADDVLAKVFPPNRGPLTLGEARRLKWEADCEIAKASKQAPPPPPKPTKRDHMVIRAIGVDSGSTLYASQMVKFGNEAREANRGQNVKRGKDTSTNTRDQAKLAAARMVALIDRLNGITQRHRGTLVVVACHVRRQIEQMTTGGPGTGSPLEVHRDVVGWAPDLGASEAVRAGVLATGYSATWQHLAAKANIIWHLFSVAPDFRQVQKTDINTRGYRMTYGAITMRGNYPEGQVMWVKRQGGSGWLGFFDELPPYWHESAPWEHSEVYPSPDLGAVLSHCVRTWRERQATAAAK